MKRYLGDSVYGEMRDGVLVLTTENGGPPSNIIILDPRVVSGLLFFLGARFNDSDEGEDEYKE